MHAHLDIQIQTKPIRNVTCASWLWDGLMKWRNGSTLFSTSEPFSILRAESKAWTLAWRIGTPSKYLVFNVEHLYFNKIDFHRNYCVAQSVLTFVAILDFIHSKIIFRLAKSHDVVVSLTFSRPVSQFLTLSRNFSCFLAKPHSSGWSNCRVRLQVRWQITPSGRVLPTNEQSKRLTVKETAFIVKRKKRPCTKKLPGA